MMDAQPTPPYYVLRDPGEPEDKAYFRVREDHLHLFTGWKVHKAPPLEDPWHFTLPTIGIGQCRGHGTFILAEIFGGRCPGCATVH